MYFTVMILCVVWMCIVASALYRCNEHARLLLLYLYHRVRSYTRRISSSSDTELSVVAGTLLCKASSTHHVVCDVTNVVRRLDPTSSADKQWEDVINHCQSCGVVRRLTSCPMTLFTEYERDGDCYIVTSTKPDDKMDKEVTPVMLPNPIYKMRYVDKITSATLMNCDVLDILNKFMGPNNDFHSPSNTCSVFDFVNYCFMQGCQISWPAACEQPIQIQCRSGQQHTLPANDVLRHPTN